MLSTNTINKLAALAKLKPEDLTAAITAATETELTIDEKLSTFSDDELKTLKSNTYADGKKAGVEMSVDEVKKKLSLDFQGKTVEGLAEAAMKKGFADAKIEPDQRVKELTDKVTNLQKTVTDQEKALKAKDSEVSSVKIKGELYKHIPTPGENGPALGQDDVIQLMQANGYEFKLNESGTIVPYKDGKPVVDKLENIVPAKDVVTGFMKEKKIITETITPDGRGGGNHKPPATPGRLSDLKKEFEAQGKSTLGEEFMKAVETAAATNKDFDMKS